MRQNQKNNRSRGRGGRKGPNPLTRSYESNGPDVKVRGTAQHIAEKYTSLARDAISSGDIVAAENYYQHAEHYNRIIMSAQAQMNVQREEERRQAQPPAEGEEQPRIEVARDENTPPPVNGDASNASAEQPSINGNGADNSAETEGAAAAQPEDGERPKPRGRRPAPRTRSKPAPRKSASSDEAPAAATGDSIAENPPAFLVTE